MKPTLMGWRFTLSLLERADYVHKLFQITPHETFLSPFTSLFITSFYQYKLDIYFVYWVLIQYYVIFLQHILGNNLELKILHF